MVRNVTGGSKSKSKARKTKATKQVLVKDEDIDNETTFLVKVVKALGNRRVQVETVNVTPTRTMVCRIPGKFGKKVFFAVDDYAVMVTSKPLDELDEGQQDICELIAKKSKPGTTDGYVFDGSSASDDNEDTEKGGGKKKDVEVEIDIDAI